MNETILDEELSGKGDDATTPAYAGFWIRAGATLVDFLVLVPVFGLSVYNSLHIKSLPLMLILTLVGAAYKPYLEWKRSATFGKTAMGIKLIDYAGNNISLEQALKRYFPWVISYLFSIITNILLFQNPDFQYVDGFMQLSALTQQISFNSIVSLYNFVFLILVGSLIFDSRKQGVHDKYAKTYCVYVR